MLGSDQIRSFGCTDPRVSESPSWTGRHKAVVQSQPTGDLHGLTKGVIQGVSELTGCIDPMGSGSALCTWQVNTERLRNFPPQIMFSGHERSQPPVKPEGLLGEH